MNNKIQLEANAQLNESIERLIQEINLLPSNLFRTKAIDSLNETKECIKADTIRLNQLSLNPEITDNV